MPFLSEEIWQFIAPRTPQDALIIASYPKLEKSDDRLIKDFEFMTQIISGIRTVRKQKNIAFKNSIDLVVLNNEQFSDAFDTVIKKLGNIDQLSYTASKIEGALSFRVKSNEYFIPISADNINIDEEIKKLTEELNYTQGFLKTVQRKLANERFIAGAPEQVVANERKKEADAIAKIETIKASLASLS